MKTVRVFSGSLFCLLIFLNCPTGKISFLAHISYGKYVVGEHIFGIVRIVKTTLSKIGCMPARFELHWNMLNVALMGLHLVRTRSLATCCSCTGFDMLCR